MNNGKYFARYGKVYGPFTTAEVEGFHASGKIREYSWVWDTDQNGWKAIDPAPAPLSIAQLNMDSQKPFSGHGHGKTQDRALAQPRPIASPDDFEVLCHNRISFVKARVEFMTETGCELRTTDLSGAPTFPENAPVFLNILNEQNHQMLNMKARICGVSRTQQGWRYQIRWDAPPNFA